MSSQHKSPAEQVLLKSELRAKMREIRQQLCPHHRQAQSLLIAARLAHVLGKFSPQSVGLYLATAYEVDLDSVIDQGHRQQREIYLPHLDDQQTPFHRFSSWNDLEAGPLNLRQSAADAPSRDAALLDMIVLPGLAFDRLGNRLGHGGAWYDRVLSSTRTAKSRPLIIGVCFEEQLVERVPHEPFDITMDVVMTPSGSWAREEKWQVP